MSSSSINSAPPKILVTGATGKTGSVVVAQLLARGFPVRALVRSGDLRSQRLEKLGAETLVTSLSSTPSSVTPAIS